MRLFYSFRNKATWTKCRWDPNDESIPKFWRISDVTQKQICYTVEANKYAQGAFLISIICFQFVNLIICKTRFLSLSQSGFTNGAANFAMFTEVALIIVISYVRPFVIALGSRAVASPHFMVPSFCYFFIFFLWDEARKVFVRAGTIRANNG